MLTPVIALIISAALHRAKGNGSPSKETGRQLKSGWIFRTVMPDVDRF
jgi:hypothetical protein